MRSVRRLPRRRRGLALAEDLPEAALEGDRDGCPDRTLLEPLDQRLQEPLDDQPLRLLLRQAVRPQVVQLFGVDLGYGRRVGAADIVGFDLEAGNRVGVGRLREQEVAALLEGVGCWAPGSTRIIPRQTAVADSSEDPAEGEIGGGVGRGVLLGCVEVEVLGPVPGVGARDAGR